ncbi:DUF4347 domain-containing protein, partial [Planctomycetota bacterium]
MRSTSGAVDALQLEDRVLFSASPVDAMVDDVEFGSPAEEAFNLDTFQLADDIFASDLLNGLDETGNELEAITYQLSHLQDVETHLLFVDERLQNDSLTRELLATADETVEIFYLSELLDGIDQITATLERHDDIDSVQIISHGSDGSLLLGNTHLSRSNIDLYASEIAKWGPHFSADADVLLLGCNVANTETGESFVDKLAALTGADFAASSDLTGNSDQGGDWNLEYHSGAVETDIAMSESARLSFDETLSTFTVTTTDDNVAVDGKVSLREAILLANLGSGSDIISFDIPDALNKGAHTIFLNSSLPQITRPVTIDGSLEPQYLGTPIVFLDGSGITGGANGLTIAGSGASGSVIRGLGIVSFDGHGIVLDGTSDVHIESNYIGVDVSGDVGQGNTGSGIFIDESDSTTIGGNTSLGNVISGNDESGITVDGAGNASAFDTLISGNRIGTSADGTSAIANNEFGINIIGGAEDTTIGGTTDADRNIISGNAYSGIHIGSGSDDTTVLRNYIGTDVMGTGAVANGGTVSGGIRIDGGATGSIIGSEANPNLIAHNVGPGIVITDAATEGHFIRGNQFLSNSGQPIDLGDDGLTPNDGLGDGDVGPNGLQNSTDTLDVTISPDGTLMVSGVVNAAPTATYLIDFYSGDTGTGSIDQFIGAATIGTASGSLGFNLEFAGATLAPGDTVYASVANQLTGSSSEFSMGAIAVAIGSTPTANDDGPHAAGSNSLTVVNVIANDFDIDGDHIRLVDVSLANDGSLTPSYSTGDVTYTSDIAFGGADDFEYRIGDDADGTIHYWGFASDASDSIGSLDGTIVGSPNGVTGEFGQGLSFDGTDDSVELGGVTYTDSFSLSFAFKIDDLSATGTPEWQVIYSHGDPSYGESLYINVGETGSANAGILRTILRDSVDNIAASALDIDVTSLVGDTDWHTYTLVVSDVGVATVFVDGASEAITSNAGNAFAPTGSAVIGGRSDGLKTEHYSGSIDTVRVFDRDLSSVEVDNLHNNADNIATASFTVTGSSPTITSPNAVTIGENIALVHDITATMPNNAPVAFSVVGGNDSALFDIVDGDLVFIAAPDFETPSDHDANNEYSVEVRASNAFGFTQQLVTITVSDVNDNPVATTDAYAVNASTIHSESAASGVLANDHDPERFGIFPLGTETLNYDASLDLNANDSWETTDDLAGFEWDMSAPGVAYSNSPVNAPSAFDAAWTFDGSGGASMATTEGLSGAQSDQEATFELWINPADVLDRDVVLDLGSDVVGTSLIIDGNQIELHANGGGVTTVLTYTGPEVVAGEYVQIVIVVDPKGAIAGGSNADLRLYVNGQLADEAVDIANPYVGWINDTSDHGLGTSVGTMVGNPATSFEGEIAMFRYYEGLLTANEVLQQFESVAKGISVVA